MASRKPAAINARNNGSRAAQAYDGARRTQLAELQRARLIRAMLDVACERGAGSVTVAHVVERSGVSRRTFYEAFSDREECFLAAFEQALTYTAERVIPAYESQKSWRERIRAGLVSLLSFFDEEPQIGKILIRESMAGGRGALERRAHVIQTLTGIVEQGRGDARDAVVDMPLVGEGVVGGVLAVIEARLTENGQARLIDLVNPLMSMIVMPYLGHAAARRELERPAVVSRVYAHSSTLLSDPFKDAGMRLTYRTVRVLLAIAEHAEASNREVGQTAGITDQGQISKLLRRLESGGLIANTGLHPGKGAPNSWALTEKGRVVTASVRMHTPHEGIAA